MNEKKKKEKIEKIPALLNAAAFRTVVRDGSKIIHK